MRLQVAEVPEQGGRLLCHQLEKFGYAGAVVFVLVVDCVAEFSNELPVIGRVDHIQPLHEGEYRTEAFKLLLFFDGYRSHGFAQTLLKLAEPHAEGGQSLVLGRAQCRPVLQFQNRFDLAQ